MKVLLWEDSGFLLLYKRLENGKFSWPRNEQEVRDLTYEELKKAYEESQKRCSELEKKI